MGRVLGSQIGLVARVARRRELIAAVVAAVPALLLYSRTLMPDVGFWDTAEFQAIGPVLGIAHPTGYPAYTLLAWLASVLFLPFGNEALRANLLSAVVTALAVGLTAGLVTRLTGRFVIGVTTALALAVSGETWAIGLRADPHALHLLLAAVLLYVLVIWEDRLRQELPADKWLFAAAVVFGISLGNHGLTFLLAPGIAVFVLAVYPRILRRPTLILACTAGLVATTLALYLYLPLRSAMNPPLDYANPETLAGFRYLVFAEQFRGTFRAIPPLVEAVRQIGNETVQQLGVFALLALLGVVVASWRRPFVLLLLALWFAVNWYFALGYVNADIGRYYLVPILGAAVLGGLGAGAILDGILMLVRYVGRAVSPRWSARSQRFASIVVMTLAAVLLVRVSDAGAHDRYARLDASRDRAARQFLDTLGARLPDGALIVSWWSYSTALWYGKYVEHWRPDVTVIDDSTIVADNLGSPNAVIDANLHSRPVFLIRLSFDVPVYQNRYWLTQLEGVAGGAVYRVDGLKTAGSPERIGADASNL
jgi:hypothetical protein